MTYKDLNNKGSYTFFNVSTEQWREYTFIKEGTERKVKIKDPIAVAVSKSGHRVLDKEGVSHFVPAEWIELKWKAKTGKPHFVK